MPYRNQQPPKHPLSFSRRTAIQAGSIGLLGLGVNHLEALRAVAEPTGAAPDKSSGAQACIYIFLSGGLAQHDSFDMKPDAPDTVRGEFQPIATQTAGIHICEHLPMLAQRSQHWALCRSMTHSHNEHSQGHHIMLTGRKDIPPNFSGNEPRPSNWPSITTIAGVATRSNNNNLPPAAVLPERLIHRSGRVIPGQFAGEMGARHDPWFIEASPYSAVSYGAYPQYHFHHGDKKREDSRVFEAPCLTLPHELTNRRLENRLEFLNALDQQRQHLEQHASATSFDRYRQQAISLVCDPQVKQALDVTRLPNKVQDRYGRNSFGWSLLMARQLVATGVNLVQVNLGNDETWDTHGNAFPHLKNNLFPPTDRAVSALLDDLHETGLLDQTLVVMAGEFGRTPKLSLLPGSYQFPGRDHWGASQTVFFAGGGVRGGTVIGATDKIGAYPTDKPQHPENLAATIYRSLGIPATAVWQDELDRPHQIYHGNPIDGLSGENTLFPPVRNTEQVDGLVG